MALSVSIGGVSFANSLAYDAIYRIADANLYRPRRTAAIATISPTVVRPPASGANNRGATGDARPQDRLTRPPPQRPVERRSPPSRGAWRQRASTSAKAARDDRRQDELRDAIAVPDREGKPAVVDEQRHQLPAIVAVDRAGRVQDGDAVPGGKARARPDLDLVAVGDGDGEAAGHGGEGAGHQDERLGQGGAEIGAGRASV